jgi:hypothetical protein
MIDSYFENLNGGGELHTACIPDFIIVSALLMRNLRRFAFLQSRPRRGCGWLKRLEPCFNVASHGHLLEYEIK